MAGSKTNYLEPKVLEHNVGKTAFTMPSVWVALYTVAPTDSTSGTEVTNANAYARQSTAAVWGAASVGDPSSIANSVQISFPVATPATWGTVVAMALVDSATHAAGNQLYWGDLVADKVVGINDQLVFAIGDLTITED